MNPPEEEKEQEQSLEPLPPIIEKYLNQKEYSLKEDLKDPNQESYIPYVEMEVPNVAPYTPNFDKITRQDSGDLETPRQEEVVFTGKIGELQSTEALNDEEEYPKGV